MELISGHQNIEDKILHALSVLSVDTYETTVEAFCLYRRELFGSYDYSRVLLPVSSINTIAEMINIVNFTFLLRKMYGAKIFLTVSSPLKMKNKNVCFLDMFSHLYEGPLVYKKQWDLTYMCKEFNITKITSHKIYKEYKRICSISDGFVSTKTSQNWLKSLPKPISRQVSNILFLGQYKKGEGANTTVDYLAPFLGVKIYDRYSFFRKPIFDFSIAKKKGLIN